MHPLWVVRHRGRTFRLALGARSSVGRGAECDVVVDAAEVSRRHAWLEPYDDVCLVEDAGSRNGVIVNGVPMRSARMEPESWIQLGPELLIVSREDGHASQVRRRYRTPAGAPEVTLQNVSQLAAMLSVCEGLIANGKLDAAREPAQTLLRVAGDGGVVDARDPCFARIARCAARLVQLRGDEHLAVALLRLHQVLRHVPDEETIAALEPIIRTSHVACAAIE